MSKRVPAKILKLLKDARHSATLEEASFGNFGDKTEEVRELVRLYHETWIIGPLERVIKWAESKGDDGA
jgi:hypothetical protein